MKHNLRDSKGRFQKKPEKSYRLIVIGVAAVVTGLLLALLSQSPPKPTPVPIPTSTVTSTIVLTPSPVIVTFTFKPTRTPRPTCTPTLPQYEPMFKCLNGHQAGPGRCKN